MGAHLLTEQGRVSHAQTKRLREGAVAYPRRVTGCKSLFQAVHGSHPSTAIPAWQSMEAAAERGGDPWLVLGVSALAQCHVWDRCKDGPGCESGSRNTPLLSPGAGYGAYGAKPAATGYGASATGYGQQAAGYGTQQAATGYGAAAAAQTGYGQQAAAGYGAAAQVSSLHAHTRSPTLCPKPKCRPLQGGVSLGGRGSPGEGFQCVRQLAGSDVWAGVRSRSGKVLICVWGGTALVSTGLKGSLQGSPGLSNSLPCCHDQSWFAAVCWCGAVATD